MFFPDRQTLIEDLLDEREELQELLEELPPFLPQLGWHKSEQHILRQCLIEVEQDLHQEGVIY